MSESSHHRDKGPPGPAPGPPPEPINPEPSVWDNTDYDPSPQTPTEAIPTPIPFAVAAHVSGDSQPTVISRPPPRTGEEMLGALRGRRLAHFELIAPIGVGGMAAVIKGRDLQLDRTVALKILPPEMAADPENIRRFHHEARAAAKLDHENIARVFFYGEDQRLHFIAFEFVQGDNLRTILERRGKIPVGEAVHYILQVATGVAHAASRGVVHRDIKPSNIIVTPNGRAKLVDMGLAASQAPQDERQLTQSGVTLGTFDYISPEQALEPREADVRSDIYSLGCTFYHMLTGQPPVPEGTAARKLHFHEHELAIDPRQLTPDVPDEVAAIIARMMAKNPRDRYQKAEHLVEHLLRVAQKLESGREHPDGVLYVDAPLPTRSTRPLFLVALAVAAVVALIFTLEQPGPQRPSIPPSRFVPGKTPADPPPVSKNTDKGDQPPQTPQSPVAGKETVPFAFQEGGSVRELKEWAEKNWTTDADLELVIRGDLMLSDDEAMREGAVLALRGKTITIKAPPGIRPTITLKYSSKVLHSKPIAALELQAGEVNLQGVRINVNAGGAARRTGVHLVGPGRHTVKDCLLVQQFPRHGDDTPLHSILLDGAATPTNPPKLKLEECVFVCETPLGDKPEIRPAIQRGLQAVVRRGPGTIEADSCVFGPHQSCFRLEGSGKAEYDLQLSYCSFLLTDRSAVFHLDSGVSANASVKYSLFSRPEGRAPEADTPTPGLAALLIRQESAGSSRALALVYDGFDNRYHQLDGFWGDLSTDSLILDFQQFESRLKTAAGHDRSTVLISSPWKEADPLRFLVDQDFFRAFAVKQDVRELRLPARAPRTQLVGAYRVNGKAYVLDKLPSLADDPPAETARKEKIVDPAIRQPENGTFKTLSGALGEAEPGDVILIKHTGKLPVSPITLEKTGLEVTIKPAPGHRPLLTLTTKEKDASLFRLHEGKLKLQDLDILLEPAQKGDGSDAVLAHAVVNVIGDGKVEFEGCTITLGDPSGYQLAAVSLGDPGTLMRKPIKMGEVIPPGPLVGFERCLVRGKGDLVWCRASRPFELRASQSLLALNGSLLLMEGSKFAESLPAPGITDQGPRCLVSLKHVTAVTASPLFHLRATGSLRSLVPVKCQPEKCLLTPLGGSKSILLLADLEARVSNDVDLRDRLGWEAGVNAYGPYGPFVEQQLIKGVDMMMLRKQFDRDWWKGFTSETESKFLDAVKFAETPETSSLGRARPSQFGLSEMKDFGANLDNLPGGSGE